MPEVEQESLPDDRCDHCGKGPLVEEHVTGQSRVACLSCGYTGPWGPDDTDSLAEDLALDQNYYAEDWRGPWNG